MRALSARDVLEVWEAGMDRHPVVQALALLAAGAPEIPGNEAAALPVGRRDGLLLALRERTFGGDMLLQARCPACAEPLELTVPVAGLRAAEPGDRETFDLDVDGLALRFRLPDSRDLAAVAGCGGVEAARRRLAERCVVRAERDGAPVAPTDLPEEAIAALSRALSEADPQAEILFDFTCPRCGHGWPALLDIGAFFWREVASEARRVLLEVDALARTYGWREADILAMSSRRRHAYMEMAGA